METPADPILARLRVLLEKTYGPRLQRVVLFGSRARGDARPDSDYDVAVFLNRPDSFWTESGRLAEIETDLLFDMGVVVNALPFEAGLGPADNPLLREIEREGLAL